MNADRDRPTDQAVDLDGFGIEELSARFSGPLFVFVNRNVNDTELAREIVNDTLLRAWRNADRFDPDRGTLATWLFGIARNLTIDAHRRRGARPRIVADLSRLEPTLSEDVDVDRALEAWQVADAIRSLSVDHREAIVEVHYRGLSIREAAADLGVPEGTVKSRLYYGLRALRLALEESGVVGQ